MSDSISSLQASRANVLASIKAGAQASGVDFGFLLKTAQRESGLDPSAKAPTSSAMGLFQFTEGTWLSTLQRYGARHGIDTQSMSRSQMLALRSDAGVAARMAGELAKENAGILEKKLGRPASHGELYLAHFLGPHEAAKLARAAQAGETRPAAELFPEAAKANPNVFHAKDGTALDAVALYHKLVDGGLGEAAADVAEFAGAVMSPAAGPQALLMARAGIAQMNSALMAALFDVQGKK